MIIRMDCNDTFSLFEPSIDRMPTWTQWMGIGMRKARHDLHHIVNLVATWSERRAERWQLLSLDDRMLKDIGISRADAWVEATKPMWRE